MVSKEERVREMMEREEEERVARLGPRGGTDAIIRGRVGGSQGKVSGGRRMEERRLRRQGGETPEWEEHPEGFEGWLYEALQTPWDYAERILGVEVLGRQREIMASMLRYPRVIVIGCNSSGKTFSMYPYSFWKLTVGERIGILQIAPTRDQSRGVFWRNMRGLYAGSEVARRLFGNEPMYATSFEPSEYRYAQAVSPGDVMALRGWHEDELLFILDEGNGVDAEFFTAIRGVTASGKINVVQLGNPTQSSGLFYDSYVNAELGWHRISISAFDSPNLSSLVVPGWFDEVSEAPGVIGEEDRRRLAYLKHLRGVWIREREGRRNEDIPEYRELMDDGTLHLTRRMFVADAEADWARSGHPSWYGQILGVFPPESEYQLISTDWINAAGVGGVEEWQSERGFLGIGIDPSGMGQSDFVVSVVEIDEVTLQHRLVGQVGYPGTDALERSLEWMEGFMESGKVAWINVDRMGAGERPAVEITRWAERWGVGVYGFVSQSASTNTQFFRDIRAQAFYYLRDLFETGNISGVVDLNLKRQLQGLRYEMTNRGQVAMESKVNMRRRGVTSPDWADALCYACFPLQMLTPWQLLVGV